MYGTFADNIDEFCMELIPFDSDLLSMEMELSFRVCIFLLHTDALHAVYMLISLTFGDKYGAINYHH